MIALPSLVLTLALGAGQDTVLLDFYGDTCPPCRQMAPVVERLAARGFPVRKVNVQREPTLAAQFQVRGIPCFVMLVNGREVDREVGATSSARLEQMISLAQPAPSNSPTPIRLASNDVPRRGASVVIPAVHTRDPFASTGPFNAGGSTPGWQPTQISPAAPVEGNPTLTPAILASSVRLRVPDPSGCSVGSGTIIDARQGWALVLTCGHLFREFNRNSGQSAIEVDVFGPEPAKQLPGQLVHFDLEKDLGLVKVRVPGQVAVARVAPPNYVLSKGARVVSVGCNNGDSPTAQPCQITFLNRYLGPPNIRATGLPVEGRSGGGLFSSDGFVVGVCNAAISPENEGLYSALGAIHVELDQAGVGALCRDGAPKPSLDTKPAAAEAIAQNQTPSMPRHMPPPAEVVQLTQATAPATATVADQAVSSNSPAADQHAVSEPVEGWRADDAEVIAIVRSRTNPSARQIIVHEKPTPELLRELTTPRAERPRSSTRPPLMPITRSAPPAASPAVEDELSWRPRWLQAGYHGS